MVSRYHLRRHGEKGTARNVQRIPPLPPDVFYVESRETGPKTSDTTLLDSLERAINRSLEGHLTRLGIRLHLLHLGLHVVKRQT